MAFSSHIECCQCGTKDASKYSRCSRCRNVIYCSSKCQKANWQKHRLTCLTSATENRATASHKHAVGKSNCQETDGVTHNLNEEEHEPGSAVTYIENNITKHERLHLNSEVSKLAVTLRSCGRVHRVDLSRDWDGLDILKIISSTTSVPLDVMKLIIRGKVVDKQNIASLLVPRTTIMIMGQQAEDDKGLDSRDVDCIISQMKIPRNEAILALRKANGNVLDAMLNVGNK